MTVHLLVERRLRDQQQLLDRLSTGRSRGTSTSPGIDKPARTRS
jgi:hypothetical protein